MNIMEEQKHHTMSRYFNAGSRSNLSSICHMEENSDEGKKLDSSADKFTGTQFVQ